MSNVNLENLTPEERKAVADILKEMTAEGTSSKLNNLILEDYKEIPVDIGTFLHDQHYLGRGLTDGEGRFTLFPYWEDLLHRIYPDPLKPAVCNTLALSGAIGIGKSTEAVIIGIYELYRMMCLRDPSVYYGIMQTDTISFAVINITIEASRGVAWDKFQNLIQSSDWFMSRGKVSGVNQLEWSPNIEYKIDLICGSQPRHFIGKALFWSFFDEISFIPNQDVERQKQKATELISSATARMQSRFMRNDVNPTILVMASSKRTEQSFLETWIENKKRTDSKTTIIVDEPQWVVRDDKKSDRTFKVAVGNKFLSSEVLSPDTTEEQANAYRDRGFRIVDVPIGYYENFLDNVDIALTDIAGISTTSLTSYISGERLSQTKFEGTNPFTKDIITVGNAIDDEAQYSDFFDLKLVSDEMKSRPLFIHLDMSLTGDKTGIGGVWIKGKKPPKEGQPETNDLIFQLAFVVSVKAPKGYQVSFEKTRNFIFWLKQQGFSIKGITMDTYQSAEMLQSLKSKGFNVDILSVDRVDKSAGSAPVCKPYQYLKSAIYEQRILIPKNRTSLLTEELIGLKRDNNSGKVDHDASGINSKDSADAICGATWTASLHADEYAYNYGESLDITTELSQIYDLEDDKNKFENSLKESEKQRFVSDQSYMDFGLGTSEEYFGTGEGICIW